MSWLNFNESLNTLKGQISNFASNVLADEEEGLEITGRDYEELKKICVQQEIEIGNLNALNEELKEKYGQQNVNNASNTKENWNSDNTDPQNVNNTILHNLRKEIEELENEKKDLIGQLEQLDVEHQQNLSKIVSWKDKLLAENNDLRNNYLEIKEQYNAVITREEELKVELNELQAKYREVQTHEQNDIQYREKYEIILQDNQRLKFELEECNKEISVLKSSNSTLQKIFDDYQASSEQEISLTVEKLKHFESENKIIYAELHKVKEDIKQYEKKSSEDAENCQKLAFILETYEKQVSSLKHELDEKDEKVQNSIANEKIVVKMKEEIDAINISNQNEIIFLKNEVDNLKTLNTNLQEANNKLTNTIEELKSHAKSQEIHIHTLRKELDTINNENNNSANEEILINLKKELDYLRKEQDHVLLHLHNKYVNIITEIVKKLQESDTSLNFQHCSYGDDSQILEFSKHAENILNILFDSKRKCEILEKKVCDVLEEKTNISTEKDHEIETLIQKSEILNQEVITKTQEIKDYENECAELAKNNELLINELENYKNNLGLQTISESNEDNMVLLESQLENANKRIEDLEKIIDDFEQQQKERCDLESANRLKNALPELDVAETQIIQKGKDYQELLNSFDQLQIECDTLKYDLEISKEDFRCANEENEGLRSTVEKVRLDYENSEYQLSEVNINLDSLKEEIEAYRKKVDKLLIDNKKLQMLNEESNNNNDEIKIELNIMREKLIEEEDNRNHLENQIRHLTEKLQIAKMAETSLKLQYDTVNKEVMALSETKLNLETTLNKRNLDITQLQTDYLKIESHNEKLIKDNEDLQKVVLAREKQIKTFQEFVEELQIKLEKYEKLAVDENEELLKKLSVNDNVAIVEELKSQLAKYESLAIEENEQLFKSLHINENESKHSTMAVSAKDTGHEYEDLKQHFHVLMEERNTLRMELNKLNQLQAHYGEILEQRSMLQQQLKEVTISRNELINIVTTKHQESLSYHNEIQRLSQILTSETEKYKTLEAQFNQIKAEIRLNEEVKSTNQEIEKLRDQNNFLKEKCEVVTKNLLEEQSKVQQLLKEKSSGSEKELILQKKLERLQTHLIELEEHYTQELLQAEQKNGELQTKVNEIEEREKSSSTMYTSVSIRANQQVESLQNQLQTVTAERDALRNKISDAEDLSSKQAAALANLQFVLEQFQKDKEKDVLKETERIRRQINAEKQIQEELRKEISGLKSQLEESKQGLQAASRLSDQLEYSKKSVSTLKEEVSHLQDKLAKNEDKLKNMTSNTEGKVDKSLIKNLIIGFVTSNNNLNKDQLQILKIIGTVLDFSQQDHDKMNLNKLQQGSWLSSILTPHAENPNASHESLSQAFIKFLENESKPRVVPSLLNASTSESTKSTANSQRSTARQSPIVLSEIVFPTFADFAQTRNSSAILKDVLKDNS